jgi:hypothetical protein
MKKRKTKRAARARKTAKRKTAKRSTRRKVATRRKVRTRPKARKTRPKAAKRRKPTVRGRRIAGARPARVERPRAAAATRGAFPAAAPPPSHLADLIAAALVREGASPSPDVVETIAAVGAGYRKGPAADSPFGPSMDIDAEVAPELVHRFVAGDDGAILDRRMHRPQVRATVDMNLAQLGLGTTGETARATLTSLTLGSWDPGTDEVARRDALAGFIVRWYRDGLG